MISPHRFNTQLFLFQLKFLFLKKTTKNKTTKNKTKKQNKKTKKNKKKKNKKKTKKKITQKKQKKPTQESKYHSENESNYLYPLSNQLAFLAKNVTPKEKEADLLSRVHSPLGENWRCFVIRARLRFLLGILLRL